MKLQSHLDAHLVTKSANIFISAFSRYTFAEYSVPLFAVLEVHLLTSGPSVLIVHTQIIDQSVSLTTHQTDLCGDKVIRFNIC